jgi:hypothetical protein
MGLVAREREGDERMGIVMIEVDGEQVHERRGTYADSHAYQPPTRSGAKVRSAKAERNARKAARRARTRARR